MKDVIFVGALCVTALVAGVLLFIYGPDLLSRAPTETTVAFTSVDRGAYAVNIDREKNYRITTPEELGALWGMVYGQEQPQLPRVDFATQEVIAVFDGTHSSGGYSIRIAKVVDSELTRTVHIEQIEPAENCQVASVVTSPFEVVVLPKLEGGRTLTHVDEVVTAACE